MFEPWVVYFLIFACVFLAAQLVQVGVARILRGRQRTRRRFAALGGRDLPAEDRDMMRRRVSRLGRSALVARLDTVILQSGMQLSLPRLATIFVLLWLCLFVATGALPELLYRLAASGMGTVLLLWGYLRLKRARRMARFGEQLPEVIDVIVRSLRAGHPLPVSLSLVAREMPEPAGPEFSLLVEEVNYGRSITEALENLQRRVGYPELKFLVASISIAHQTGGNLGDILSRLSRMLRDRFRLMRRVRALSAEGRFSGYALSALPLILFGLINLVSASYYADFWASPAANTVLAVSLGLLFVGNVTIYRMVNFKV